MNESPPDLDAIQQALGSLPEVVSEDASGVEDDLLSIAGEFSKLVRKLGVQRLRTDTDIQASMEKAASRIDEVHEAALAERNRAVESEAQVRHFAGVLIEHVDFLDRAIAVMRKSSSLDSWIAQLESGLDNLLSAAQKVGLSQIGIPGEAFAPEHHEPVGESVLDNTNLVVRSVLRRGFALNGRILRTAKVDLEPQL